MADLDATGREAVELVRTILDTHHVFVKERVPALAQAIVAASAEASGHAPTRAFAETYSRLHADLTAHLEKEEGVLFPMIEELHRARLLGRTPQLMACGVEAPITQMRFEHTQAKAFIQELRSAVDRPPEDPGAPRIGEEIRVAVRALQDDLEEHIRKEDDELFPRAVALYQAVPAA